MFTVYHWHIGKGTIIPHLTITSCNSYSARSWPNPRAGSPCVSFVKCGSPWLLLITDYVYQCFCMFLSYLFHSDLIAVCFALTKYSPVACQVVESLWWFHPSQPWTINRNPCGASDRGWTHIALESHLSPPQMAGDKSTLFFFIHFQMMNCFLWKIPHASVQRSLCTVAWVLVKNTLFLCWYGAKQTSKSIYCTVRFNWYNQSAAMFVVLCSNGGCKQSRMYRQKNDADPNACFSATQ